MISPRSLSRGLVLGGLALTPLVMSLALPLVSGCSTSSGGAARDPRLIAGFDPPAPIPDSTRMFTPVVKSIQPGADLTWCDYVANPFGRDVDVVQSEGYQSHPGHHALLMEVVGAEDRLGQSHECTDADMTNARFLAGGADGIAKFHIPDGVAFRISSASVLMVQTHWINTTSDVMDGQAVFDIEAKDPSPDRQQAQLFAAYTVNVSLPPRGAAKSVTDCKIGADTTFFAFGGHAHEWATHITITQRHGGTVDEMLYDHDWQPHFQSDPPLNYYDPKTPLTFKKGDILHLECTYQNTTGDQIQFPREMCVAEGFYFPGTTDIQCADGTWIGP